MFFIGFLCSDVHVYVNLYAPVQINTLIKTPLRKKPRPSWTATALDFIPAVHGSSGAVAGQGKKRGAKAADDEHDEEASDEIPPEEEEEEQEEDAEEEEEEEQNEQQTEQAAENNTLVAQTQPGSTQRRAWRSLANSAPSGGEFLLFV